jgi:hypothetical protein
MNSCSFYLVNPSQEQVVYKFGPQFRHCEMAPISRTRSFLSVAPVVSGRFICYLKCCINMSPAICEIGGFGQ